jgi:hypothetical protein
MRIKQGFVMVVGISKTTTEICKNLVLAGANLIAVDDRDVTDDTSNFLIALEADSIGLAGSSMTVGEATARACRQLNEHPSVSWAHQSDVTQRIPSVNAVVCSFPSIDYHTIQSIAGQCRDLNKAFFLVVDSQAANWSFSDFGKSHVVETHTAPLKRDERTGDRKADNRVIEYSFASFDELQTHPVEANIANTKPYFPLHEVFFVRFLFEYLHKQDEQSGPSPKRTRRSSSPSHKSTGKSFMGFVSDRIDDLARSEGKIGKTFSSIPKSSLIECLTEKHNCLNVPSMPHFAAIHGALVSQEIVKYITKRDVPLVNQIVLNPNDCGAIVVKSPMSLASRLISGGDESDNDVELVNGVSNEQVLDL